MADVLSQEAGTQAVAGRRAGAWMLPVIIALLAISIMAAAALAVVLATDEGATTRTVTQTRTIVLPALTAQDIAAAKAMKDESKIATAVSGTPTESSASSSQKTEAAMHALSVRSIALQQRLEASKQAQPVQIGGHPVGQDEIASGTAAKDEAGVAAAVGNP